MTTDARPLFAFLTEEDQSRIHQAALRILDEIGMQILHDDALRLLHEAGCPIEHDTIVKIPPMLVEQALSTAPRNIPVYSRTGEPAMDLGGRRSYYGTGSDLMYTLDSEHLTRSPATLADVCQAARVCDALPQIDFIMSYAHPSDLPASRAYLASVAGMAENSVKPIVCTAECHDDLSEMWQIARTLRGGEDALIDRPYLLYYGEPISPLKHPYNSLDKLLFCAETRMPAVYSPAPLAGSTAPLTIAGHVAQGLAECFCGLVIHQLRTPGAPFLMGMGAAVLDMATSQSSYNAPEYYMAYVAMIEMSHYFDLPSWGYAGTSDAQIPDGQATLEAGLITFLAAMAGANLNHDVGYLNFGLTGCLEMIVINDEIISQIRRMKQGIPVNEETLAVDVIREVGHGGHHLVHPHTLKHLRTTQWRPTLLTRKGYDQWEREGRLTLLDRARLKLQRILAEHQPLPIPAETLQRIRARVEHYQQ